MSDLTATLYHHLPASLRTIAVSARGYYLRWWRYGAESERLIAEALEREQWSRKQWQAWHTERLGRVLHRAATRVPYYREQWAERRRRGDRASWEYLENWQFLEKETLRRNAAAFVADDCHAKRMYHERTSGTTGTALDLWIAQDTLRRWYALFELRCRRWYAVAPDERWAMLGGQLVIPSGQRRPPFWVWNQAFNQLYMSSYHLAPDLLPYYLDALARYGVKFLLGYTSSLYELALAALREKRDDLRMIVAVTNAEPVFDYQRQAIEAAFQCQVRETYGMAEIVAAASECQAGHLHLYPEVGLVEVTENKEPVTKGVTGDLICTGLLNADMPLIRYQVGDRGALATDETTCRCGRSLPVLREVEGRADDVLYTPDGRHLGRLDPIFKSGVRVREAQIIQETLERVRVLYVPAPDFTAADGQAISGRLRERMGDVEVVLEAVSHVPRGANGKFRAVICNLSPEQKKSLYMGETDVMSNQW